MTANLNLRAMIALVAVLLVWSIPACAQGNASDVCQQAGKKGSACNGISIGAPKVFDNRTLTLMLDALMQTLQSQQQNFIDQKSLQAALANIQGYSQSDTSTSLNISGSPTPALSQSTTTNTGLVGASGNPLPNTTTTTATRSRPSVTPQAPTLDTTPAFQGFNPTYGSNASDLLNDQVNLNYQIFNLRMILERALTDRLLDGATDENQTRLQAVLGINVTIDPPRTANDAVAVVEITLRSKDGKPLSLVSLMPQEKTYNAAALSSKSNAYGGSAAVSAFQVGFSARKRSQTFYLYRDNDTLSYERMTGDPSTIVFGWMFRPVLGRRSVSPGLRQLFAVMALPNLDCTKRKDSSCPAAFLTPTVRTYWKKYDRATLTSFERQDTNRASQIGYALSLGLARPQIFEGRRYQNDANYPDIPVRASVDYQDALKPIVTGVTWRPTGSKNIIISARGNNFFTQTQVALGDKTYIEGAGLTLKSDHSFDLITTLDALVNGPGTILGRYDNGVPLINSTIPDSLKNGFEVQSASLSPAIAGLRKIEIHLQRKLCDEQLAGIYPACKQELDELKSLQTASTEAAKSFENASKAAEKLKQARERARKAKTAGEKSAAKDSLLSALQQLKAHPALVNDSNAALQKLAEQAEQDIKVDDLKNRAVIANNQLNQKTQSIHALKVDELPREDLTTVKAPETPVISINGTPLDLPYQIANCHPPACDTDQVVIQAYVKDSLVSDSGGGIVKVSWPFYPQDRWTYSYPLSDPALAFGVTRVSAKSILINRKDGWSFMNGPENTDQSTCWKLIAGDNETPLTRTCPQPPKDSTQNKPAADPKTVDPKKKDAAPACATPIQPPSDFVVIATVDNLPDKVMLVAPNGAIYNLSIPAVKATDAADDKTSALELKQYDSQWIDIKSADLTAASDPAKGAKSKGLDLSQVVSVEANAKPLNFVKNANSITVEITRDLTSKPGTVDIGFHDAKSLLGTRQLHITQTESSSKGDK